MANEIPNKIYVDHMVGYGARCSHERLDKKDVKYIRAERVIEMLNELAKDNDFEQLTPEQVEELLL